MRGLFADLTILASQKLSFIPLVFQPRRFLKLTTTTVRIRKFWSNSNVHSESFMIRKHFPGGNESENENGNEFVEILTLVTEMELFGINATRISSKLYRNHR
jgi:hypothetical protein